MVTEIYIMFVFVFVDFNLGKTEGKRGKPINLFFFFRPVLFTLLLEEMFALWKKFHSQEKYGKRTAEDDIFSGFKKKKGEGEGKAAMIPREEVQNM